MNIARVGDRHKGICNHGEECCPHNVTGEIVTGSNIFYIQGMKVARKGDSLLHDCPHCGTGVISEGTSLFFDNGIQIARMNDKVEYPGGSGEIIDGSDIAISD